MTGANGDSKGNQAATEPPAGEPPRKPSDADEERDRHGPYGNPAVDEETLRKKQEERHRDKAQQDKERKDDALG